MPNNKDSIRKGSHLTLSDRIEIETMLDKGYTAYAISKQLGKSPSTITREIEKHICHTPEISKCLYYYKCQKSYVCGNRCCKKSCKKCKSHDCTDICSRYVSVDCEHKDLKVCNGCEHKHNCLLGKRFYRAKKADDLYKDTLYSKRVGFDVTDEELATIDTLVSPLIQQGLTPYHISITLKDRLDISPSTIYRLINSGALSAKNIDLPEKVARKPRFNSYQRKIRANRAKASVLKQGREYKDFLEYTNTHDVMVVQMDCVEGKREDNAVTLSLHWVNLHMQLYFILNSQTSDEAVRTLDKIETALGTALFSETIPVILTDNGGEFWDIYGMERSCLHRGQLRTKIFFCEPNRSDEKGACERNHRLFRKIIPKGTSMEPLDQFDLCDVSNHVNSYKRKALGGLSPYNLAKQALPEDFFVLLGLVEIPGEEIILKPSLIN